MSLPHIYFKWLSMINMISLSRKFVFIHIPKTGGTTILNHIHKTISEKIDPFVCHASAKELALKIPHQKDFFWFSFVRNPYDRIVSAYLYLKNYAKVNTHDSFEMFVLDIEKNGHKYISTLPMTSFIGKDDILLHDISIYKYENFNANCEELMQKLNINNHYFTESFFVNHSIDNMQNVYTSYYIDYPYIKSIIQRLYKEDFITFEYEI